jgi:hypothetical protein
MLCHGQPLPEGGALAVSSVSAVQAADPCRGPFQMQPQTSLPDKILEWLNKQGFPTEFQVANICDRHGFRVFQGYHVRSESPNLPREIDVLAQRDDLSDDYLIRVCHMRLMPLLPVARLVVVRRAGMV